MPSIRQLFLDFPFSFSPTHLPDISVSGIAIDNRQVQPGFLFVARPGASADGHDFIPDAIRRGQPLWLGRRSFRPGCPSRMSAFPIPPCRHPPGSGLYGHPGRKLTVIGVTGTDGKTTTSNLIYHILLAAGLKAGIISTVNAVIGDEVLDTGFHVTTPDAHDVQRYLARMVEAGLTHVVLETTSHGLAQHRVDASEYDIAVVTNITHEHLDEHGSYENYRAAKGRLFELLAATVEKPQGNPRLGVLNLDDTLSYGYLSALLTRYALPQAAYGLTPQAAIRAERIAYDRSGLTFDIVSADMRVPVRTHLVGAYNVSNCLAAFTATVMGLGIEPETAARGIAALPGIPGAWSSLTSVSRSPQLWILPTPPTPIKVALQTARQMTSGARDCRLWPADLRDREKRRLMAENCRRTRRCFDSHRRRPRTRVAGWHPGGNGRRRPLRRRHGRRNLPPRA